MPKLKKIAICFLCVLLMLTALLPVNVSADVTYNTDYPNSWTNTGNYIEDLIGVAMTQVGYYGNTTIGTKYGAWYGTNYTYSQWCAMFVAWCANQAGIPTSVIHKTAKANNYRNSGTYHYKDGYTPKRGDLVLYNPMTNGYSGTYYWPSKNADGTYKESSHVAIVCSYDSSNSKIWVVHGNSTGDKVCYNSIAVSSNAIQAFVTPPYSDSSSSGDTSFEFDYVNDDGVNMRSGAGTEFSKVASLNKGTGVEILESVTNSKAEVWYKVKIISTGQTGYIRSDYVTILNNTQTKSTHSVNGDNVRLRSKAGTDGTIVGEYDNGTALKLLGVVENSTGEKWYKIKIAADGKEGYMRSDFIKIAINSDTPYVNGDNVRLRSSESTTGSILGEYDNGTRVEILTTVTNSKGEKWHKVIVFTDKIEGYIRSDFISVDEAQPEPDYDYVNASYDLRSAPGTENTVIATVSANTKVSVLEAAFDKDGDKWFYVKVQSTGKEGYIYYKRVTLSAKSKDAVNTACSLVSAPDGTSAVCSLAKGDTVTVLGITYDGKGNKKFKVSVTKSGTGYVGYLPVGNVTLYGGNRKNITFQTKLESPAASHTFALEDTVVVRGWAFSNIGEALCYYSIDSGAKTPMPAEKRTDINSSYADCTTDYSGFKLSLSANKLSYGEHTVEIFASSDVTVKSIHKFSFSVVDKQMPQGSLQNVDDIDETGYTLVAVATDNIEISSVYAKTTVNGTEKEHFGNLIGDNRYSIRVKTADFSTANSNYSTKVYARDSYGNIALIGQVTLNPKTYEAVTVSFDANGGVGAPASKKLDFSRTLIIEKSNISRDGYYFAGWSTVKDGAVVYKTGVKYTFDKSVTLYAVWSDVLIGDCNNDGTVTTVDLAELKLALSTNEYSNVKFYDLDLDGKVTTVDLAELKLRLAGLS